MPTDYDIAPVFGNPRPRPSRCFNLKVPAGQRCAPCEARGALTDTPETGGATQEEDA